jgi:PqqD family protein of HPr-rel-A system
VSEVSSPQLRWRGVPRTALTWREWGDELVVFNHETGSTHLLDGLAGAVLHELTAAESGVTLAALVAALTDDPSAQDRQECAQAVNAVLTDLSWLGLAHADKP